MKRKRIIPLLFLLLAQVGSAWDTPLPEQIRKDYVEADAVLDEDECDWRETVAKRFRPAVANCSSAKEATLYIASHMTKLTGGVHYSTARRKANLNALEALAEKKASCTGLSIMLTCALRSVGIPARAVCVLSWNHTPGNHTWVEAWVDGEWKMLEFNEKDFNSPWVMEYIGMLDTARPEQRIYAVAPSSHTVLRLNGKKIPVEDVTERYMRLARAWYAQNHLPADSQRLLVDIHPRPSSPIIILLEDEQGAMLASVPSCTEQNDQRRYAPLNLPRAGRYYLRLQGHRERTLVQATPEPAQIIRLSTTAAQ